MNKKRKLSKYGSNKRRRSGGFSDINVKSVVDNQ